MSAHRPAWRRGPAWSWWRLAPLDSALSFAIVLVCMVLCVQRLPPFRVKLGLVEALTNLPSQTGPFVEALALTGELDTLQPLDPQPLARFRYGRQAGQAVAVGLDEHPGPAELRLGMRLAVQEPGLAWHTWPLCGLRPTPDGWRSAAAPLARGLTDEQLPFICSTRQAAKP